MAFPASAAVVWDESVNGNLSNNYMAPTPITVGPGQNVVTGSLPVFMGDQWRDYFRFTVPTGFALMDLKVLAASNSKGNSGSIIGITAGNAFSSDPSNGSGLLGFIFFGPPSVGGDLLAAMATPNSTYNTPGFAVPITSGTYSVWVQDYDNPASYSLALRFEAMVAPSIKIVSKKVGSGQVTLRGKASGTGTKVFYQVGKGAFKPVRGKAESWVIVAKGLKKGTTTITIRAKGLFGTSTKKEKVVVK